MRPLGPPPQLSQALIGMSLVGPLRPLAMSCLPLCTFAICKQINDNDDDDDDEN